MLYTFSICLLISQFTGNKHLFANKRETFVLHYYKLDFLYMNDLYFNVFNLHFTFWISPPPPPYTILVLYHYFQFPWCPQTSEPPTSDFYLPLGLNPSPYCSSIDKPTP